VPLTVAVKVVQPRFDFDMVPLMAGVGGEDEKQRLMVVSLQAASVIFIQ
jgi:hypothetical protein